MQVESKSASRMERTAYPGVYRRGDRYVATWRHRGRQYKETFRTLAEARAAKGARAAGDTAPSSRVRFEDYAREWLALYNGRTERGLAESTREDYRRSIERWAIPFFSGVRLSEIEPRDVRGFVQHLEETGQRPSTVRKNVAPLRTLFATAVEDGLLRASPTAVVRIASRREGGGDPPTRRALTRVELAALLEALPEDTRMFVEFLVHTGLRISEALALTWSDVQFGQRARIKVRRQLCRGRVKPPKTRYGVRDVPLSPGMTRRLWELRANSAHRADHDFIFATTAGSALDAANLRSRVLRPAMRRAGIEPAGFHILRHTCASLLFEAGKNVKQVQEWLGHHDPGFTLQTYVHLLDEGLGDAGFFDGLSPRVEPSEAGAGVAAADAPGASAAGGYAPKRAHFAGAPRARLRYVRPQPR